MLDCALIGDAKSGHLAEPASEAISPKPMTLTSVRTLRQHTIVSHAVLGSSCSSSAYQIPFRRGWNEIRAVSKVMAV